MCVYKGYEKVWHAKSRVKRNFLLKAISKNIPQLTWVEFEPNLWKYQVGRKKRYQSWKWEKLKFNKTVERNTKNPYRISDRIKIRSVEQEKVDCYAFQNFSFSILKCLEVFLQHSAPERWKEKWKWLRALPARNAENGTFLNWIERIIRRIKRGGNEIRWSRRFN